MLSDWAGLRFFFSMFLFFKESKYTFLFMQFSSCAPKPGSDSQVLLPSLYAKGAEGVRWCLRSCVGSTGQTPLCGTAATGPLLPLPPCPCVTQRLPAALPGNYALLVHYENQFPVKTAPTPPNSRSQDLGRIIHRPLRWKASRKLAIVPSNPFSQSVSNEKH